MKLSHYKTFIGIGGALALTTSLAIGLGIWRLRSDALADAQRNVGAISKVLAQETSNSSQAIELVLDDIIREMHRRSLDVSASDFNAGARNKAIYDFLTERLSRLPQADVATLVDQTGEVRAITRGWPTPSINLSDRDYFKYFASTPTASLFISEPVQNKVTGTWTVYFAKRLETAQGQFLGLVLIGVRPEYFMRSVDVIASIPGQTMLLLRRDGEILLRYPDANRRTGEKFPDGYGWRQLLESGGGFYRSPGLFDEGARIVSVQPIAHYNLALNVALREDQALAAWKHRAVFIALSAFVAEACFLIFLYALYKAFRRREEAEVDLRRTSLQLTDMNERLADSLMQYEYLAHHDTLCGLRNRSYFMEALANGLSESGPSIAAILLLDLDFFKDLNDTFGHHAGDWALREVARRLEELSGEGDVAARLGGDEFAILLAARDGAPEPSEFAQIASASLRKPYKFEGFTLQLGVSIGLLVLDDKSWSIEDAMKNVDLALYQAKADGRNCIRVFDDGMRTAYRFRRELAADIRRAIDERELELHYQPIVRTTDFRVEGMEALLRWTHGDLGPVPPNVIVQVAEEVGLIHALGAYVLRRAFLDAARWSEDVYVSVNVSGLQVNNETFPALVTRLLAETGLNPHRVVLEITETALISDQQKAKRHLDILKSAGLKIALDDFGTGYSSLSYLHAFSFDKIKIDKSFVDETGGPSAAAIVDAVVRISQSTNSTTVAEGIETLTQMNRLTAAGVSSMQGYLFGRPRPNAKWDLSSPLHLSPYGEPQQAVA